MRANFFVVAYCSFLVQDNGFLLDLVAALNHTLPSSFTLNFSEGENPCSTAPLIAPAFSRDHTRFRHYFHSPSTDYTTSPPSTFCDLSFGSFHTLFWHLSSFAGVRDSVPGDHFKACLRQPSKPLLRHQLAHEPPNMAPKGKGEQPKEKKVAIDKVLSPDHN
jgi:hypothetical protein